MPRHNRYPLYRRLGGPQGRSGRLLKISLQPTFDPRTFQPVARRYTDWAILAHGVDGRSTNEYAALVEWYWQVRSEVLGEKSVQLLLCPSQIPCGLAWDWSGPSSVSGQRLAAWALAKCWSNSNSEVPIWNIQDFPSNFLPVRSRRFVSKALVRLWRSFDVRLVVARRFTISRNFIYV
jgi:hypothetical protein